MGVGIPDSKAYSMFPLDEKNKLDWEFYGKQEETLWSAKELDFSVDIKQFPDLPESYKQLYYKLFAFFSPGDGLVSKSILRYMGECEKFSDSLFFNIQLFIETVHAEAYGMSITSVIPDKKVQQEVFGMVDELECVQAKVNFFKSYIDSDLSKVHRYIASAVTERIFFVSLFAFVFYFRDKNLLPTFTFLNEQVSKDETLHGDFYCAKAKQEGLPDKEEVIDIVTKGVEIEIEFAKYLLESPIDSKEEDEAAGMTIENLTKYIKMLGDQVFILLGMPTYYKVESNLPWIQDMSNSRKSNFYERQVGSYRKFDKNASKWQQKIGLKKASPSNPHNRPQDVDF